MITDALSFLGLEIDGGNPEASIAYASYKIGEIEKCGTKLEIGIFPGQVTTTEVAAQESWDNQDEHPQDTDQDGGEHY
jgi:hypothetical protein